LWGLCKTDIFDRGAPWTRLMLRAGAMANTLNVKPAQRVSVALVGLTGLLILAAFIRPMARLGALTLTVIVTALNFYLYRFFAARRGIWCSVRVAPIHLLYFCYWGFSFLWGTILH